MPTGIYKRTKYHISIIRKCAKERIGKYRVGYIVDENSCWIWQGAQDGRGYGHLKRNGRHIKAYRFYYEQKHGEVPKGMELDHKCQNKLCCNPDHLEPVTHAVNSQRAVGKHSNRILELFKMYGNGFTKARISEISGIPERTVCSILNRETWKNIEIKEIV